MTARSAIQLVCFDLGGVVVRICPDLPAALANVDVPVDVDWASLLSEQEQARRVVRDVETGRIDMPTVCRAVGPLLNVTAEQVMEAVDHWILEVYPGIGELIDALRANGITTCCLSNTNAHHWAQMMADPQYRNVLDKLDHRFASHLLGLVKPEAAIFEHVEQTLNLPGEAIAYFDDTPGHITAARQRGWCGHAIDPDNDPPAQIITALRKYGVDI